jgi:hypothetical protein
MQQSSGKTGPTQNPQAPRQLNAEQARQRLKKPNGQKDDLTQDIFHIEMSADSADFPTNFEGNSNNEGSQSQGQQSQHNQYNVHSSQYKHHNINLKQINQQNAHSMERPQNTGQANVVQLKGKISKNQTSNAAKGAAYNAQYQYSNQKNGANGGGQGDYTAQHALEDQQTYQMTRSQEPPVNRGGKNQQKGHKNQGGIKQLVLEDPMASSKMVMPPISNTMKKTHIVDSERQARQE